MKFFTMVSVTFLVICGTFSSAAGADWISIYDQGGVDYYYDRESITTTIIMEGSRWPRKPFLNTIP